MRRFLCGAVAAAALLAAPAARAATAEQAAALARPIACADLTTSALALPGVAITGATLAVDAAGLPEHCIVRGRADPRIGVDGRRYAIGFEMRLPLAWNGRFLHQVNGGNDGEVVPAIGDPHEMNAYGGESALARGFAVLSSDEGHDGKDPANAGARPGRRHRVRRSTRRRATITALPAMRAWDRSAARSSRATTAWRRPRRT